MALKVEDLLRKKVQIRSENVVNINQDDVNKCLFYLEAIEGWIVGI